ncbi:SPOR domain-containing protein [Glaciecola sp. SC05]|uniref:SPOR domain-containing protein n=1 Tax=Glaciecola sp. SC05 TaxID=1987355 RepID=UPI003529B1BD
MNSALQNRLVGTIIVVALVVILLPEILDGEKTQSNQEFVDIPPPPASIVVESAEQFPQQILDDNAYRPAEVVDEIAIDDVLDDAANSEQSQAQTQTNDTTATNISRSEPKESQNTVTAELDEPEVEIEVKDSGWVIQLGSFRNEKNVNELIATLRQAGYRAYSQPVKTKVGMLNKVFVGPELERVRLEQALPHLQELTQLKGKITAFEVSAE